MKDIKDNFTLRNLGFFLKIYEGIKFLSEGLELFV